jgi:signal peptidase I
MKIKWFKRKKKEKKKREVTLFREYFEMIAEVLIFVFFINSFLLQSQAIPTGSMEDTMLIGDHLLVDRVALSPYLGSLDKIIFPRVDIKRGTIVTFKGPAEMDKDYVKRVIGLPGEKIQLKNKTLYINGQKLDEPYVYHKGGEEMGDNFPMNERRYINALGEISYLPFYFKTEFDLIDEPKTVEFCKRFESCVLLDEATGERVFKIPEGHYFCMGDNRDNSYDSRFWGPLPEEYIIGKPWRIYWSFESTTDEYLNPEIGHKIKDIFKTIATFFQKTRWKRTFKKYN